jgi:chemotaxis response regulator CheB
MPDGASKVRVFILSSQSLFDLGVENLLRQEAELEVVGREADIDRALVQIKILMPDVVILNSADASCSPTPAVLRLMNEVGTRIIKLNLQDNTICMYREEQRMIEEVGDLAKFVCQVLN